jgi:hypothetical protein
MLPAQSQNEAPPKRRETLPEMFLIPGWEGDKSAT